MNQIEISSDDSKFFVRIHEDVDSPGGVSEVLTAETVRVCNRCEILKPIELFEANRRYRNGYMPVCRSCRSAYRQTRKALVKATILEKVCSVCDVAKSIIHFNRAAHSADGYSARCRACKSATRKPVPPIVAKDRMLRWKYGIDLAQYNLLFTRQAGLCAICHGSNDGEPLCVDHDHSTGHVRALLCHLCNTGLGGFRDDVEHLRTAIDYLNHFKEIIVNKDHPAEQFRGHLPDCHAEAYRR